MPGPLDATPYEVLGVRSDVDEEELKRAYRRRLRETHPDTGGTAAEFRRVQEAWDRVGTAEARAAYDRGHGGFGPEGSGAGGFGPGGGGAESAGFEASARHTVPRDTRPRARSHGHPGGWRRERYLSMMREWVGRGVPLDDPYDPALVRSAPFEIRHALADALAEEATARALAELGIGYTVWHDVAIDDGKIDHVLLGPTGLFAVQSEDFGGPVALRRGELVGATVTGEPLHELGVRARHLGRALHVKFAGAIVVLPDDALDEPWIDAGRARGLAHLAVRRSVLAHLARSGVPGVPRAQGVDLFEVRTRLSNGIRFI